MVQTRQLDGFDNGNDTGTRVAKTCLSELRDIDTCIKTGVVGGENSNNGLYAQYSHAHEATKPDLALDRHLEAPQFLRGVECEEEVNGR